MFEFVFVYIQVKMNNLLYWEFSVHLVSVLLLGCLFSFWCLLNLLQVFPWWCFHRDFFEKLADSVTWENICILPACTSLSLGVIITLSFLFITQLCYTTMLELKKNTLLLFGCMFEQVLFLFWLEVKCCREINKVFSL